jgi:hypothetical protein
MTSTNATTTAVDPRIKARVASHHARFSPHYGGYLSDHGPMAALAYHALGTPGETVCRWLDRYVERLQPEASAPAGYLDHLSRMLDAVRRRGAEAVLTSELPRIISGWARDAYHPLIRTAYGVEFGIDLEVAAGLAYLHWCGADETIERLARRAERSTDLDTAFARMATCATTVTRERNFNQCLAHVTLQAGFSAAAVFTEDTLLSVSRQALNIFAATHDFFALHLVTGSHAYHVLYPYAGELRDPIFALGILAGYASVGAPSYSHVQARDAADPAAVDWLSLVGRSGGTADEHDVKLAHSAERLSAAFDEPAYARVVARYLRSRRGDPL